MEPTHTVPAPGVVRIDCYWGYDVEGKKAALIAAGQAEEAWFPDGKSRDPRGRVVRTLRVVHEGRKVTISQKGNGDCFALRVCYTEEERARRALAENSLKVQRKLDALPASAQAFRVRCARALELILASFLLGVSNPKCDGYRLHPETIGELERIAGDARNVVETGKVLFSAAARAAYEQSLKSELARSDPDLQKFLGSLRRGGAS